MFESVTVFEKLAEPGGGRLLVVGTYRPDGLSRRHPAAEMLPRLERHRIPLGEDAAGRPVAVSAHGTRLLVIGPSFCQWLPRHAFTSESDFELAVAWARAGIPGFIDMDLE